MLINGTNTRWRHADEDQAQRDLALIDDLDL